MYATSNNPNQNHPEKLWLHSFIYPLYYQLFDAIPQSNFIVTPQVDAHQEGKTTPLLTMVPSPRWKWPFKI
jgi:hypothetical protein